MSNLLGQTRRGGRTRRSGAVGPPPPELPPSVAGSALLAAAQAAGASLTTVLVPVVVTWVATTGGAATWADVVRVSLDLWLAGQHTGLVVPGGHLGLMPLGLSLAPLLACWYAGRRLARVLDPRGDRIAAGASIARPAMPPLRALVAFAAAYALLAGLAASLAAMPTARPIVPQAVLGAGITAALAGTLGAAGYRHGGVRAAVSAALSRLPEQVERVLRPAVAAVAVQLLAGMLVLVTLIVLQRDRVLALHRALHPDAAGSLVLVLLQVALLPNLGIWVASALAGPGFALGTGTAVSVLSVTLGPLPAVPVLGALPATGPLPAPVRAVLTVGVLAGVVAGVVLRRGGDRGWVVTLLEVPAVGLASGAVFAAAAWLAGGPAGPGRLAVAGPRVAQAAGALAGEVSIGVLALVVVSRAVPVVLGHLRRARAGRVGGG